MSINFLSKVPYEFEKTEILQTGRSRKQLLQSLKQQLDSFKAEGSTITYESDELFTVVRQTEAYSYPEEYQVMGNILLGYSLKIKSKLGNAFHNYSDSLDEKMKPITPGPTAIGKSFHKEVSRE